MRKICERVIEMISNDKRENGTYQNQDTKLNTKCDPNFIIVFKDLL